MLQFIPILLTILVTMKYNIAGGGNKELSGRGKNKGKTQI